MVLIRCQIFELLPTFDSQAKLEPQAALHTPAESVCQLAFTDSFCCCPWLGFCIRGVADSSPASGSTDTSLWTHYSQGKRQYCGNSFPDGMRKNDRFISIKHLLDSVCKRLFYIKKFVLALILRMTKLC